MSSFASGAYYRDVLPTRVRLIDKALQLVGSLDETDNRVFESSVRVESEPAALGIEPDAAKRLSLARIFGAPPNRTGSGSYDYWVERSGEWDSRDELAATYIDHSKCTPTPRVPGAQTPEQPTSARPGSCSPTRATPIARRW